jgi:hypothetical protein
MAFEELVPRRGAHTRSAGVTVAWRKARGNTTNLLVVTLGSEVCDLLGLKLGLRMRAERDVILNRLRLHVDAEAGWKPAWKGSKVGPARCASMLLPLPDVNLSEAKPAQAVSFEFIKGGIDLRLPSWVAAPGFIKVPMRAA